jgi:WD40 repeat protein
MRRCVGLVVLGVLAVLPAWQTAPGEERKPPAEPAREAHDEGGRDEGGEATAAVKPVLVLDSGGHTAEVVKVLFTPDGQQVVTVSRDKTVRVWDVQTGQTVRVLRPPIGHGLAGELFAGALSPDGKTLAVAGYGVLDGKDRVGPIYLIPLTGGPVRVLKGIPRSLYALAFSPDGKRLAAGWTEGTAVVWDAASGRPEKTLLGHTKGINVLAFSPDGSRLATGSSDRTVRLWSVASGKGEAVLEGAPDVVMAVAWSADGKKVHGGGLHDGTVHVWDAATGAEERVIDQDLVAGAVLDLTVRDGQDLLCTWRQRKSRQHFRGGTSHVNPATGAHREGLVLHEGSTATAMSTALTRDGKLAATSGGDDHQTYLWSIADGKVVHRLAGLGRPVFSVGWSAEVPAIGWGVPRKAGDHKPPLQWSLRPGDLTLSTRLDPKSFGGALRTHGGLSLVQVGQSRLAVKEGDEVLATLTVSGVIDSFTLLPGDRVAVGVGDWITLFEARTGKHLRGLGRHLGRTFTMAPSPDGKYLVSGSTDQTVRVWDPRHPNPVLSVFAVGSEWVAWTPEGYYAASPGGERLMGWHVNNGTDKLASFYPASRFRASLYRPDLIRLLLADGIDGDLKKALAAADRARGRPQTEATEVADVLPPKVTLAAPGVKEPTVHEPTLEVAATALGMGKHPVKSLQLLVDGRPYEGNKSLRVYDAVKPGEAVKEKWTVQLTPGEHSLRVLARSAVSMGMSDDLEVTYAQPVPRPSLYLLAVGIDSYKDKNLKLKCAVQDATELEKAFEDRSKGLFDVKAKVLRDGEATQAGLLAGLDWLKANMKPHDLAVVFYAGHGDTDAKGRFYLLPQDVDVGKLADTGVSGDVLKQHLADLPGKVVLLLDACHSGSIGRVVNDLARDLAGDDSGVVVMCAALGDERAGEANGHGFFCQALIEALEGKAAKNPRDGCVYFHHLEQYVMDRVPELSRDEQHATTAKPSMRPLPLAKP